MLISQVFFFFVLGGFTEGVTAKIRQTSGVRVVVEKSHHGLVSPNCDRVRDKRDSNAAFKIRLPSFVVGYSSTMDEIDVCGDGGYTTRRKVPKSRLRVGDYCGGRGSCKGQGNGDFFPNFRVRGGQRAFPLLEGGGGGGGGLVNDKDQNVEGVVRRDLLSGKKEPTLNRRALTPTAEMSLEEAKRLTLVVAFLVATMVVLGSTQRTLHFAVVVEKGNSVAKLMIPATLRKMTDPPVTFNLIELDQDEATESDVCNSMFGGDPKPDVLIDAVRTPGSTEEKLSTMVRRTARQMGLPTVSLTYGVHNDYTLSGWDQLSPLERDFLVHITPPGDLYTQVIRDLCKNMDLATAGIIYDNSVSEWRALLLLLLLLLLHCLLSEPRGS
ncbi:hypothetical protein HPB48_014112 [Haemaphysalis longicornis]|uniref:Uncharacterized protein n=1 Tax=Haemaphysalis longicornis TaxID=44386 RepID=A0A9J6FJ69_HAELO|nr:hypothetical protein HPB48_014112 [Haemaphysalis longicornis]